MEVLWATEGLTEDDYRYTPAEQSNSLAWVVAHIWGLMNWVQEHMLGSQDSLPSTAMAQRDQALELILRLREHVAAMSEQQLAEVRIEGLPFWHMINGPLSDALTHIGQIASFRRLNGNVVPRHYLFLVHPPE